MQQLEVSYFLSKGFEKKVYPDGEFLVFKSNEEEVAKRIMEGLGYTVDALTDIPNISLQTREAFDIFDIVFDEPFVVHQVDAETFLKAVEAL